MPVRIVQSKQNARLKLLRRALTRPGRDAGGLLGVEGRHLLEEALRVGLRVRTVFVRIDPEQGVGVFEPRPEDPLGAPDVEVLMVPAAIFDSIMQTETPQPVAALVEMPDWTWAHLFQQTQIAPLIVVLAGLQDPGNLGTILRSAEAFGANGVVCLPGTVNPWNPKAVRASAGSIFRLPVIAAEPEECFSMLRQAGAHIYTTAVRDAKPADQINLSAPLAFLIGNEGGGVPPEIAAQADAALTIPCPGPVESLNAAAAASVLLYEAARQRRAFTQVDKQPLRGSGR